MHDTPYRGSLPKACDPKFDLQQLRYAVMAEDFGSFRQAAEASLVKQSTLSRSIKQLEYLVGVTIFERSTGGIRPTSAGRDFLRITRSILEQMDALVTATRASGRGDTGRLAIGFCTSLTAGNLRTSLLEFQKPISSGRSSYRGAFSRAPRDCTSEQSFGHSHPRWPPTLLELRDIAALERAHFGCFAARSYTGIARCSLLD